MKRMISYLVIAAIGLAICGWLIVRHAGRNNRVLPDLETRDLPVAQKGRAIDRWQSGIHIDTRTDYATEPRGNKWVKHQLLREELRQKPWRARN